MCEIFGLICAGDIFYGSDKLWLIVLKITKNYLRKMYKCSHSVSNYLKKLTPS